MKIVELADQQIKRTFLDFPKWLYKDDPNWVAPLDVEIEALFDPKQNPLLKNGSAKRWVLFDEKEKPIGRISAFFDGEEHPEKKVKSAGIGHFECIDDQKAANTLFKTAEKWLASYGFQAMDGPINFGENNTNWGLLIDGFTPPTYGMNYHFPYYQKLFENYGFKLYFEQFSYLLDMTKEFPPRFWKIAEWVCKKPGYTFEHFNWKQAEKFVGDLVHIYNRAWADFKEDYKPMDPDGVRKAMNKAKPIIDEEMIWFAYHNGEPIAFYIMFPDINQILKYLNGRLTLWNKLKFLYYKNTKKLSRARAQAAGVVPKFQKSGVESGIFWQLKHVMERKSHYTQVELSWVGDFNPRMIAIYEAVGAKHYKTHHTYRYMIDKSIPFERFMPEELNSKIASKARVK